METVNKELVRWLWAATSGAIIRQLGDSAFTEEQRIVIKYFVNTVCDAVSNTTTDEWNKLVESAIKDITVPSSDALH